MLTNTFRDSVLGLLSGQFASLLTAITDFRAGTVTEANYTGYGVRPAITFGSPGNTTPTGGRQIANSVTVGFPTNAGVSQDCIGFGVHSAAGGGTLNAIGLFDADPPVLGTADDTGDLITAPAHGLSTDQRVFVLAAPGALLPAGLSEGTAYFVLAAGLTADAFKVSTTSGGAAVNITAKGAALFMPYTKITIANSATPSFANGTLVIQL